MVDEVDVTLKDDGPAFLMACAALLLYLLYYLNTNAGRYGMDVSGHMDYVRYIAILGEVPGPNMGWVFYHPPLYYLINAIFYNVCKWMEVEKPVQVLRLFSLACYLTYLWFGYRCLRLVSPQRSRAFYAGWALLLFWPSGIYISSRIDSNVLLYPLWAASFFYLLRWQRAQHGRDAALALGCTALAVLTRNTALTLLPLMLFILALAWRRGGVEWRKLLHPAVAAAALLLAAAAGYNHWRSGAASEDGSAQLIANFDQLGANLKLETTPATFLTVDPLKFFFPPYNLVHNENSGREYYWLALLKSSLYGEFGWKYKWLGRVINASLLLWLACLARAAWVTRGEYARRLALPLASIAVLLAASIYARLQYPAASTQDFRYIYPLLIPLAMLQVAVAQRCMETGRTRLAYTGFGALALMMAGGGVLIFLNVLIG